MTTAPAVLSPEVRRLLYMYGAVTRMELKMFLRFEVDRQARSEPALSSSSICRSLDFRLSTSRREPDRSMFGPVARRNSLECRAHCAECVHDQQRKSRTPLSRRVRAKL
jgi:hypothetical protein